MDEPVGKASGRTFNRMSTYIPYTCWSSSLVTSFHALKMSIQSPSEALKIGLAMSVYAMMRSIKGRRLITEGHQLSNLRNRSLVAQDSGKLWVF